MHYLLTTCAVCLLCWGMSWGQSVSIPGKYHWKNRILMVYAESDTSLAYQRQLHEFEDHPEGIANRDLVIFRVFPQKVITPQQVTVPGQAAHQLRQKYNVSGTGLTVVLVGKDGGEKLTQRDFLSANQLFGTIDQMPMRKREMREKKSG